jgi:hypothetical protein
MSKRGEEEEKEKKKKKKKKKKGSLLLARAGLYSCLYAMCHVCPFVYAKSDIYTIILCPIAFQE